MRLLVAEDDRVVRRMLEVVLGRWGYGVQTVTNGLDAWKVLQQPDAPSLVLMDWMMPELDGLEVCQRVRQTPIDHQPYIILVTTKDRKEDVVLGLEAGANDYVGKPFHKEELHARIRVGQRVVELQTALARRVHELEEALAHIKTLQGILPICMHCHKIRTDQESWVRVEKYIQEHSDARFSHGICPECNRKFYPDYADEPAPETVRGEALRLRKERK